MKKDMLIKVLMTDNLVDSIYSNLDILLTLIPELKNIIGFEHNHPHHHLDVWNHTLLALSFAPKDFYVRLALLLHDIGKPHSYQDEEVRHFKGHAQVSGKIALDILNGLGFNCEEIELLYKLILEHDTPIKDLEIETNKLLIKKKFAIQVCDSLAHNPLKLEKRIRYLLDINEKLNEKEEFNYYNNLLDSYLNKYIKTRKK